MPGDAPACGCFRVMDYVRNHMRRDGDSERHVQHKAVWVMFLAACAVTCGATALSYPTYAAGVAMMVAFLVWAWVRREVTDAHIGLVTVGLAAFFCYADLVGCAMWVRGWPLFVILADLLLVVEAPRSYATLLVGFVLAWNLLVAVEFSERSMGLFELPGSPSYDLRRTLCDCEKPPCPRHYDAGGFIPKLAVVYIVFITDFLLTRGFANKVLAEKDKMAAAAVAAEYLAGRLADFDLAAAEEYLHNHAELPDELAAPFASLLANLESYRPYLPSELFHRDMDSEGRWRAQSVDDGAPIPGLLDRQVALVFTDIRASTALWDNSSGDAMERSLRVHDDLIRTALYTEGGYEVKTSGDSFFISFSSAHAALRFGFEAQTALVKATWAEGLARPNADDGFPLLAVRMGVHCGEAVVQRNALTGRYDYFGPTVNRAARVEPFGAPGAVTVTADVVAAAGGAAVLAEEEGFVVMPYPKERRGKGLKTPLALTALIPQGVAEELGASVRALVEAPCVPSLEDEGVDVVSVMSSKASQRRSSSLSDHSGGCHSARSFSRMPRQAGLFSTAVAENACVGVVQFMSFPLENVGLISNAETCSAEVASAEQRLQVLHAAVQATRGHVTSVVGGRAWVSWGLQTQCTQCVNESARCMVLLRERLPGLDDALPSFSAGLVTGPLATVELAAAANRGRRFVTMLGACVDLGAALCSAAAATSVWVLAAAAEGSDADDGHAQLRQASPAGQWDAAGAWRGVAAYSLDLEALASVGGEGAAPLSPGSRAASWRQFSA